MNTQEKTDIISAGSISFYFPERLKKAIRSVERDAHAEEIRLRVMRPIQIITAFGERYLTNERGEAELFFETDSAHMLSAFCNHSVYAHQEELKNGYLSLPGGIRVGVAGRGVADGGKMVRLTDINAYNIRLAREHKGAGLGLLPLICEDGAACSTLILSPPGVGKTTVLRDLSRLLSNGTRPAKPTRVSLIDERGELAGSLNGIPQMDVGERTDVFDACPKAQAISMAIRSMSPEVLITDELGGEEEMRAALDAAYCGVSIITSAHGKSIDEARTRPAIRGLLDAGVFKRAAALHRHGQTMSFECMSISRSST